VDLRVTLQLLPLPASPDAATWAPRKTWKLLSRLAQGIQLAKVGRCQGNAAIGRKHLRPGTPPRRLPISSRIMNQAAPTASCGFVKRSPANRPRSPAKSASISCPPNFSALCANSSTQLCPVSSNLLDRMRVTRSLCIEACSPAAPNSAGQGSWTVLTEAALAPQSPAGSRRGSRIICFSPVQRAQNIDFLPPSLPLLSEPQNSGSRASWSASGPADGPPPGQCRSAVGC
jgi:hypothetical protein